MRSCMRRIFWTLVAVAAIASLTGCGTALSRAAQKGDVAAMEKLLNKGADINESAAGAPLRGHHCHMRRITASLKWSDIWSAGARM